MGRVLSHLMQRLPEQFDPFGPVVMDKLEEMYARHHPSPSCSQPLAAQCCQCFLFVLLSCLPQDVVFPLPLASRSPDATAPPTASDAAV